MSEQGNPLGYGQEILIWPYKQMVYAQPSICPIEWHTWTPIGLWHTNGSPNIGLKKKRTCKMFDFAVPADHRIKLKDSEKKDKYLDLTRQLKKKLWNMKVTVIPIVIGALGTVTRVLLRGLEDLEISGRVETIQNITLLKTARIPRSVLKTWGDLMSLKRQWKTISWRWCEKLSRSKW